MPRAVVSVHNKANLAPFMQGLVENDWQLFGTSGTQQAYYEATDSKIPSLTELILQENELVSAKREMVAQQISGLMIVRNIVELACINLRPPRLERDESGMQRLSLDVGGMSMIAAAGNSGAYVVTSPNQYNIVLSHIASSVDHPELKPLLQVRANQHIAEHLDSANSLFDGS